MENRNGHSNLQTSSLTTQPSVIGIQTSAMGMQNNTLQTSLNSNTNLSNTLNLQSSLGLSISTMTNHNSIPQTSIVNSIRGTKIDDLPHNLVLHRGMPVNDVDTLYRPQQSMHLRNGIHDSYRRDADISPPHLNNHDNYRRMQDYEDDDHSVPQRNIIEARLPDMSDARLAEDPSRIVKPAPLQARLLSLVDSPDVKDPMRRSTLYVIPQNSDKKIVFIKNEPPEAVQVSAV